MVQRLQGSGRLSSQIGCGPEDSVCLLDQVHDGALVPLEWSLSRSARTALDARATSLRGCLP